MLDKKIGKVVVKIRNQMQGREMAPLRAPALLFVLGAGWHGEQGVGRHATPILGGQRGKLRAGRLRNGQKGLLGAQEGRRGKGRVLGWQPSVEILRRRAIRTGAQIGGPGRHG
jgi:hypothetical protein